MPSYPILYEGGTSFTIHTNFETLTKLSNYSVQDAEYWFVNNELVLKKAKTRCLNFSPRYAVNRCDIVNLLGFCLGSKLLWNSHIIEISRVICVLHKFVSCVSPNVFTNVYYDLFHCHLFFGVQLWGISSTQL